MKLPAMVSQVILPTGEHVATHRTWLGRCPRTRAWVKADAADLGVPRGNAKKMLGKSRGGFIPLRKGASQQAMGRMRRPETLYVTEGIEDGLTVAMCKPEARVIAAYSLGNLGVIEFPPAIETIVLVADRDDGVQEQEKLERAIARQQARGHRVQLVLPPPGLKDVNAWLLAGLENAA
ncbi:toprim domain-containing protein [Sphingomonas sp. GV3]|uniref:toprim domain-containing protein n=1 Tax=Sphingomonas sp. GV3 TaxID=3040671 RepID=UPI00280B47F3|nr:toprim domain-containing protein [Sphingomonas sp. GV3]